MSRNKSTPANHAVGGNIEARQLIFLAFRNSVEPLRFRVIHRGTSVWKHGGLWWNISILCRHSVGKETRGSRHEVSDATSSYKYGPEECARPIPRLIPSPLSLLPRSLSLSLSRMVISLRLGCSEASACIRTIGDSPRSADPTIHSQSRRSPVFRLSSGSMNPSLGPDITAWDIHEARSVLGGRATGWWLLGFFTWYLLFEQFLRIYPIFLPWRIAN